MRPVLHGHIVPLWMHTEKWVHLFLMNVMIVKHQGKEIAIMFSHSHAWQTYISLLQYLPSSFSSHVLLADTATTAAPKYERDFFINSVLGNNTFPYIGQSNFQTHHCVACFFTTLPLGASVLKH